MARTSLSQIEDFLALKRIAVAGVSRNKKEFSYTIWQEFLQRRYQAIPVNPNASELDGKPCFKSVADITPSVEGALIMTTGDATQAVLRDCLKAGVKKVWLYGGMAAKGASKPENVAFCDENGIDAIVGFCPYMFLPGTGGVHGVHRFFKKLTLTYPKHA